MASTTSCFGLRTSHELTSGLNAFGFVGHRFSLEQWFVGNVLYSLLASGCHLSHSFVQFDDQPGECPENA